VIVDGAPRVGSLYTLSHWPDTPTPEGLRADLSAEIARSAIARPEFLPSEVDLVSIDHYDVDGVTALALLVHEGLDEEFGPLLVEAARVGDFNVVTDRGAALIAFALNGLDAVSPDPLERCGALAQDALGLIPDLAADQYRFEALWHDEWEAYDSSVRALDEGWATIEEIPETDLAIVRVDTGHGGAAAAAWESAPLHPAAVHSATSCLRIVTLAGRWMEFHYRYESWVRLASHRPRPRVDLDRLAHDLTAAETAQAQWVFDGAGSITGALHLVGEVPSTIEADRVLESVRTQLDTLDHGPPAWNPYDSR
jgi:hypothetical protein